MQNGIFTRIREDIDAALSRDPAARNRIEVVLCYPGFHALVFHRLAHALWRGGWKLVARWIASFARFFTGIEIHPAAKLGRKVFIDHGMGIVIGETAEVGDNVTLYHGVTLGGISLNQGPRHPKVGNDAIIGAGAKLLGPIRIGEGARIGSNAVVVDDVAPHTTVIGVPAHPLKAKADQNFEAYGMPMDEEADPILEELKRLRGVVEDLKQRVDLGAWDQQISSLEKRKESGT